MIKECISVIVPVYNVAQYLPHCLQSLRKQTYDNLEIILIDDGSTDKSGEICDVAAKDDSRIRVVHQENRGVSAARNCGIQMANGEFIGFMDPDDQIAPSMYEELITAIKEKQADASFCSIREVFEDSGFCREYKPELSGCVSGEAALYQCLLPRHIGYFTSMCNKLFVRSALINKEGEIPKLNESLSISEDELWLVQVLPRIKKVALLKDAHYTYLMRSDSAMHNQERLQSRWCEQWSAKIMVFESAAGCEMCRSILKARLYQNAVYIGSEAYGKECFDKVRSIWQKRKEYRAFYFRSGCYSKKQKIRFIILEIMIELKMPSKWVKSITELTTLNWMQKENKGKEGFAV